MDDHPRCRGVGSARVLGAGGPTTVYRDNGVDGYRVYRRLEDVETHLIAEVIPGAGSPQKLLSSSAWISAALAMVMPKSSAKTITLSVVSSANSLQRQRLDGLRPNTSMHGVEELVEPPYLFGDDITYTLHLGDERREVTCRRHAFAGWVQRYERGGSAERRRPGDRPGAGRQGTPVGGAHNDRAEAALREDPFAFVGRAPGRTLMAAGRGTPWHPRSG